MNKYLHIVSLFLVTRILIALGAVATTAVCEQPGVVLQGTYEYVVRPENAKPAFSARYRFEVFLSGCAWIISYEDLAASTNADLVNTHATASCDGTNIYFVQFQSDRGVKKVWGDRYDSVKDQLPIAVAKIFPGNYPPPEEFTLLTIWFAFAGNCVLGSSSGRAKPMETADLAMFYVHTNFSCGYYLSTDSNLRARKITLTNDGYFATRDVKDGTVRRLNYAPPYHKGFIQGVGIWTGETNAAGVSLARSFEYTAFAPQFGRRDSPEFVKTFSYTCAVTNIEVGFSREIPAMLPTGRILVTDRRLAHEGWSKLDYIATNGWLSRDDDFIAFRAQNSPKSSFESEVLQALGFSPGRSGWLRYSIWVLLVLPLCIWGVGVCLHKLKKQKTKGSR